MNSARHPPVPARHRVYPTRPTSPAAAAAAAAAANGARNGAVGRPPPSAWSRVVPRERHFPRR